MIHVHAFDVTESWPAVDKENLHKECACAMIHSVCRLAANLGNSSRILLSSTSAALHHGMRNSQVLSAKRALTGLAPLGDAGIGGAGKDGRAIPAAPGVAAASAGGYYTNPVHGPGAAAMPVPGQGLDTRAVVQVLERIENAINDGIGVIRAQQALQAQLVQPAQMQMPQAPMQFNGAGKTI